MNIEQLTQKIIAPFLLDEETLTKELYHSPVKSIKASVGKNPILDLALEYNKDAFRYFTATPNAQILLTFGNGSTAIKVKKLGKLPTSKVELDLVDRNISSTMSSEQVIDVKDHNYDMWLSKFYSQNNWVKGMITH